MAHTAHQGNAARLPSHEPKAVGRVSDLLGVLRNRDFRLLWAGEGVSLLGDQFYLIALPWLVLRLTASPLAIGTVLALAAVPRAAFMLLGGALTDRFSPRAVMLCANVGRFALVASLAALAGSGLIRLWMLYGFALLFGLAGAFYFPAQSAMIPTLLGFQRLQTGNAIIQGTAQLSVFLGPVLAGATIALLDGGGSGADVPDIWGIGAAFAVDALTFLVSAGTLAMMRLSRQSSVADPDDCGETVWSSILSGLRIVWNDRALRYYFLLIAAVNLLMTGPISVGIPVLAGTRFSGGAVAFGTILSGLGAGSLVGVVVAGLSRKPSSRRFPLLMLTATAALGVGLAMLGVLPSVTGSTLVAFLMGCGQGYLVIQFITWLQIRTPAHMLGRMMSILMFAVMGVAPLSSALAGILIEWNVSLVLLGAGVLIVGITALAAASPSVWRMAEDDAEQETPRVSDRAAASETLAA